MTRALLTAITTGIFCGGFAWVVNAATMSLNWWQIIMAGMVSGFTGSLVAYFILGRKGH